MWAIGGEIRRLTSLSEDELYVAAKELQAPYELVVEVARAGKLPVTMFTAGGIATRRRGDDDAARRRGRLRGLGHLQVRRPRPARGGHRQGHHLLRRSRRAGQGLAWAGEAMVGINVEQIAQPHRLAERGW